MELTAVRGESLWAPQGGSQDGPPAGRAPTGPGMRLVRLGEGAKTAVAQRRPGRKRTLFVPGSSPSDRAL